jgi:hypothetical protein
LRLKGKKFYNNYHNSINNAKKLLSQSNIDIIYLKPKDRLKVGGIKSSKQQLIDTFNQGINETIKNENLEKFISDIV